MGDSVTPWGKGTLKGLGSRSLAFPLYVRDYPSTKVGGEGGVDIGGLSGQMGRFFQNKRMGPDRQKQGRKRPNALVKKRKGQKR